MKEIVLKLYEFDWGGLTEGGKESTWRKYE